MFVGDTVVQDAQLLFLGVAARCRFISRGRGRLVVPHVAAGRGGMAGDKTPFCQIQIGLVAEISLPDHVLQIVG